MPKSMRVLWITDPWSTLDHSKETTLRLMEASLERGWLTYWSDVKTIEARQSHVFIKAKELKGFSSPRSANSFEFQPVQSLNLLEFDRVHYRPDPPVDLAYLYPLHFIAHSKARDNLVNPVSVLLESNEKLLPPQLSALAPPSLATCDCDALIGFAERHHSIILKPLNNAQSKGVEHLIIRKKSDRSTVRSAFEKATLGFQIPVFVQKFLPDVSNGETRLWFSGGKLIANIKRIPPAGEFRILVGQGARLEAAKLNLREKRSASQIGKFLQSKRITLAAVDLIEGLITDFNFTSPGLLVEMEQVLGVKLASRVLDHCHR